MEDRNEKIIRCLIFDTIVLGAVWIGFFGTTQKLFYGILAVLITLIVGLLNFLIIKK